MSYLFEMHLHDSEVSRCSPTPAAESAEMYCADGRYAGVVVTNHLSQYTYEAKRFADFTWADKVDYFWNGYEAFKEAVNGRMVVLPGLELRFYNSLNDYLVYGVTREFLDTHGDLMAMNLRSFTELAHENGMVMVQAHPFRRHMEISDWKVLDGYEVFNGNPRHWSNNEFTAQWAKAHHAKIVTSGSDFHEPEDLAHGGIYFDNPITTNEDLVRELLAGRYTLHTPDFEHTNEE